MMNFNFHWQENNKETERKMKKTKNKIEVKEQTIMNMILFIQMIRYLLIK